MLISANQEYESTYSRLVKQLQMKDTPGAKGRNLTHLPLQGQVDTLLMREVVQQANTREQILDD